MLQLRASMHILLLLLINKRTHMNTETTQKQTGRATVVFDNNNYGIYIKSRFKQIFVTVKKNKLNIIKICIFTFRRLLGTASASADMRRL